MGLAINDMAPHDPIQVGRQNFLIVAHATMKLNSHYESLEAVQADMDRHAKQLVEEAKAGEWSASAIQAGGYIINAFWVQPGRILILFASIDPGMIVPDIADMADGTEAGI